MALKEQNSPYKKPVTRKRKAEDNAKKGKAKKGKKIKKKGRAMEPSTDKPNGTKCKSEKIPTYDLSKIPKGLLSIRDLTAEKKKQVERQLALDGLEYSFDINLEPD